MLALIRRIADSGTAPALLVSGREHSFTELDEGSQRVATALLAATGGQRPGRVGLFVPPGFEFVVALLGVWRCGATAVPLCLSHPAPELGWVLEDSGATLVIAADSSCGALRQGEVPGRFRVVQARELLETSAGPKPERPAGAGPALILYTSGSTGRAKGVALTTGNLEAQIRMLVSAWEWSAGDRILHALPLHHTHGLVNALLCALWSGASCEFLPGFDAAAVWSRLGEGNISVFMGVPTMYRRLIDYWKGQGVASRNRLAGGCARLRLMVSGSAALPPEVFKRWKEMTGHTLLERYGMTEIGMALSNPLHGERRAGTVGVPLPGVEIRRMDEAGAPVREDGIPGEIEVRSPAVFQEYWNRPGETRKSFRGRWFRTGDVAVVEDGYWRILGRLSVDIIKSGGYKVSALEVENVLMEHPLILECAVLGVEDREWGERVCAVVTLNAGQTLSLEDLRSWAKQRLAPYKIPRALLAVDGLPRNVMGKVVKARVREILPLPGGAGSSE